MVIGSVAGNGTVLAGEGGEGRTVCACSPLTPIALVSGSWPRTAGEMAMVDTCQWALRGVAGMRSKSPHVTHCNTPSLLPFLFFNPSLFSKLPLAYCRSHSPTCFRPSDVLTPPCSFAYCGRRLLKLTLHWVPLCEPQVDGINANE